jgi:hypothetical protein
MTTTTEASYDRALAAEPRLRPIVRIVDALCALVGPDHQMCSGCIWTGIVKPLVTPLVGWERGYAPDEAKDPEPGRRLMLRPVDMKQIMAKLNDRRPATTDTEKWLRSGEAYDAFTDVLMDRLDKADPANGHGIGWVER